MNILAIGAHFDDVELGCGGTIAQHCKEGDSVTIFVATNSGYTDYAQKIIRKPEIALAEGKKAARIMGVKNLICGKLPTNDLEFNDALSCQLIQIIETEKIEMIYTHWDGDTHHDHQNLARASLAAGRHIPRMLMYRSNYYDSTRCFSGNYYVDITDTVEIKTMAIKAHESEFSRIGQQWLQFFLTQNQNDGQKIGVKFAETFQIVKYLR